MPRQFIHPNWHPLLIHAPLGLLAIGLFIEIFGFLWRRNASLQAAGRWMILLGALLSLPSATSGIYAFRMVIGGPSETDTPWYQVKQKSAWPAEQWHMMAMHLRLAAIGAAVASIAACTWLAASDRLRQTLYWPALIVLIVAFGVIGLAAWYSGESVYTQGTAVIRAGPPPPKPATQDEEDQPDLKDVLEYYSPPLQLHVVLVGFLLATSLAALALTVRRWNSTLVPPPPTLKPIVVTMPLAPVGTSQAPTPSLESAAPALFPGRFWLVALILALCTVAAGLWTSQDFNLAQFRHALLDSQTRHENTRLFVHIVLGLCLVFFTLLMTLFTTLWRRWRTVASVILLLLLIAFAGQLYMGVMLTYDSMSGPLTHFNAPGEGK